MKRLSMFFSLVLILLAQACSDKTQNNLEYNPEWKNTIYERLGVAPVDGGFQMEDYWVWGSSVIKGEDGLYHMFVSRWPKNYIFHPGWMVASEIVHAVSETIEGPYRFSEVALPARGAQYWDGRSTHNPKIMKYKDTYVLYYMGSTHPFEDVQEPEKLSLTSEYATLGRANKRIGIATSKSPYGPWERRDQPILDTKPNTFYSFLTSNPAPWINEDGSVVLVFKARKYKDKFPYQGDMVISVATAPHYEGPYTVTSEEPIFSMEGLGEAEDPSIWRDRTGYHMIIKDQRGQFTGARYNGFMVHSHDGIHWMIDKNPLAYTLNVNWSDGRTEKMGHLERATPFIQDGVVTHIFFATMDTKDGSGSFNSATKSWNTVIPLKPVAK